MPRMLLLACLTALSTTSCDVGSAKPATVNEFCLLTKPFRPDDGATTRWTLNEKRQALSHNAIGKGRCGWTE